MEIWCDSAQPEIVTTFAQFGWITGVTTNPKILSMQPVSVSEQIDELLEIQQGFLAVQVVATTSEGMLKQAKRLHALSSRIIVKIPMVAEGIKAISLLQEAKIPTLATAVFGADQFLLAAKMQVDYVAPYLSQMQQHNIDIFAELAMMQEMIQHYGFTTKVMAAGIEEAQQIKKLATLGIAAITLPPHCLLDWIESDPLTLAGTQSLNAAWAPFAKQYAHPLFSIED